MRILPSLPLSVMVCAFAGHSLTAATPPGFGGLGDLPGGNIRSTATGVSADGSTVSGNSSSTLSSTEPQDSEGFRWRQAEGIVGLGFLQETEVIPFSPAASNSNCLSADGSTSAGSGFYKTTGLDPFPEQRAAYWIGTSQVFDLPPLASASGNFIVSEVFGSSDDGLSLVGRSSSSDGVRAVVWTLTGGGSAQVDSLGVLATQPIASGDNLNRSSTANSISGDGSTIVGSGSYTLTDTEIVDPPPILVPIIDEDTGAIIGYRVVDPPPYETQIPVEQGSEAFVWTSQNGIQPLGDLAGGGWFSEALGVSDDGSVIVGYGSSSPTDFEGLIWTDGVMANLGDLPGGDTGCKLHDVSGDGAIAVGFGTDENGETAVIWNEEYGLRSLSTAMTEHGIDVAGWILTSAIGISADGDVIVGNGINPSGDPEAWRLTGALALFTEPAPPTPSVALELGMVITFPTEPGNLYQAEYSMNLVDWLPLGEAHSTVDASGPSSHSIADPGPRSASKFYRIDLLPGSVSEPPMGVRLSQGAVLTFPTVPGFVYQAKESQDLVNWIDMGDPISTSEDITGAIRSVFHPFTVYPKPVPASNNFKVEIEVP